jgi:hypothetical protein
MKINGLRANTGRRSAAGSFKIPAQGVPDAARRGKIRQMHENDDSMSP